MASKKKNSKNVDAEEKSKGEAFWTMLETTLIGRYIECFLAVLLMAAIGFIYHTGWAIVDKTAEAVVQFVVELPKKITSKQPKQDMPNPPAQTTVTGKQPVDLVPDGFTIYEEIKGDLNKDSLDDVVLVIESASEDERGEGGIIIGFNMGTYYDIAVENRGLFTYENGGVGVRAKTSIKKGVLVIDDCYGIDGILYNKTYKFRHQNANFELIGYDFTMKRSDGEHYYTLYMASVNFMTKRILIKTTNHGGEVFNNEIWKDFAIEEPITLQSIETLDHYDVMVQIGQTPDKYAN